MKQTESIQNIIKEVEKKKEEIASKQTEILTLQHQNIILSEQGYIQKDKFYMLETELQDRKRIFENLYIKYKKKNQNMVEEEFEEGDIDESAKGFHKKGKVAIKNDKNNEIPEEEEKEKKNQHDISDLSVLEGIQNYLDKQIQRYDRYRMMKQLNFSPQKGKNGQGNKAQMSSSDSSSSSSEDSDSDKSESEALNQQKQIKKPMKKVFNPFTCIQVRFKSLKQGEVIEGQKMVLSIRVEEKTKFIEIKRAACQYWQVKDPNSKEVSGILTQTIAKDDSYSFMDLCDETNSTLPDSLPVIQFLMQKGYKNLSQCTLILRPKEFRLGLDSQQGECTRINKGTDQQKSQGQYYVTRVQVNSINPYDYFFQEYPSLKFYIELKRLHESEGGEQNKDDQLVLPKGVTDSHCCILTFIIMIITVTAIYLSKMLDVEIKHESNKYFTNTLKLDEKFSNLQKDQIYDLFLRDIIGNCFFDSQYSVPKQGYFKDNFELIGNLRIRFQRQELKQCDVYFNDASKNACFDQDSFNQKKDDVGFGLTYQFQKFQEGTKDSGQQFTLRGTYGEYTSEGYMFDFSGSIPREQYRYQIEYLKNSLINDYYLRVLIVTFSLYNPSLDLWVNINLIIERDRFGLMSPYKPKVYFFRPNIYDGTDGSTMLALDIIRLISTLILLLFIIVQIYNYRLEYITSILGFLNVVIVSFSIASLVISFLSYSIGFKESDLLGMSEQYKTEYKKLDLTKQTLSDWIDFQNKYFVDLTFVGYLYSSLQSIQSILITILLFRLIFVFNFSIYLKTIVDTIKNAGNDLLKYFVIFLPLLISFAFIFYQIWGAKVQGYNNLIASLCSVILMTIGFMSVDKINEVDTVWSIIFVMLFYLMIIFLLFTFIMGILIESQHGVVMQKGYPSMQKTTITGIIIIQWLFQWIPDKLQNQIRNIIKKLKGESPNQGPDPISDQDSNIDERKNLIRKESLK